VWNSRIFVKRNLSGDVYGMRETYYDDEGKIILWDQEFNPVFGETVEELIERLRLQLRDAERFSDEVLDVDELSASIQNVSDSPRTEC